MTSAVDQQQRRGLAAARRAAGHTQESLAELLGLDRSTVARWEQGLSVPKPWNRPKLATALDLSRDRLAALLSDTIDQPEARVCHCATADTRPRAPMTTN